MTEHDSWGVASDDEGDPEELRRIAHMRLCNRASPVVAASIKTTLDLLPKVGIQYSTFVMPGKSLDGILFGGIATVFFRYRKSSYKIEFTHQSPSGVMVRLVKNNSYLNNPILWAPGRDPWVITYLIAGYFKIERAVDELHLQTDLFCEYGQMRGCMRCRRLNLTEKNMYKKMKVRLVPLWDEDDPERAGDATLNIAKTFYILQQPQQPVQLQQMQPRSRKLYIP